MEKNHKRLEYQVVEHPQGRGVLLAFRDVLVCSAACTACSPLEQMFMTAFVRTTMRCEEKLMKAEVVTAEEHILFSPNCYMSLRCVLFPKG